MASLVFNKELNGIELYFDKKPLQTIIDSLKNAGFRWHNFKKCWYAKQSEKTLKIAQSITSEHVETITEAKSSTAYFPLYDSVDGSKILQDSNTELYNRAITGLNIDTLKVTITEEKAINTFSPFVEIKPIKKPENRQKIK